MAYNPYVYALQQTLKKHVRRDSFLWRNLKTAKLTTIELRARVMEPFWSRNSEQFAKLVTEQSQTKQDQFQFIQVGAHNGLMDDPIRNWILKFKWTGIFIEPQKEQFEQLKNNYARVADAQHLKFENSAISKQNEIKQLFKVKNGAATSELSSGLASFVWTEHLETFNSLGLVTTEDVNCITFENLLTKHNVSSVDFLQIDTEGFDYEIIKMFDFNRIKPSFIHFEHRHLSTQDDKACCDLLSSMGYTLLRKRYDTAAFLNSL